MHRRWTDAAVLATVLLAGQRGSAQGCAWQQPVGTSAASRSGLWNGVFIRNEGQWRDELLFAAPVPCGFVLVRAGDVIIQHVEHLDEHGATGRNIVLSLPATIDCRSWSVCEPAATPLHFFRGSDIASWRTHVLAGAAICGSTAAGEPVELRIRGELVELSSSSMTHRIQIASPHHARSRTSSSSAVGPANATMLPGLTWSAQLGSNIAATAPQDVLIHNNGLETLVTVVGHTAAPDFPVTAGAWDITFGSGSGTLPFDAFVATLSADGTSLYSSTFLGGSNTELVNRCLAGPNGGTILLGQTFSSDYPTTPGAVDTTFGLGDCFITHVSPSGDALVFSTYLGGGSVDTPSSIAMFADGSFVVVGGTASSDYPLTGNAFDTTGGDLFNSEGFITRISADVTSLVFSSYLGAVGSPDWISGVATLGEQKIVVTGTASTGAAVPGGAFVAIIDTASGVIGNSAGLDGVGPALSNLAVAPDGGIIEAGTVIDPLTFSGTPGSFDPTFNGQFDGVIARIKPDLSGVDWLTFYGTGNSDNIFDLSLDVAGHVIVSGTTSFGLSLPTTPGALMEQPPGQEDFFVARFHRDGDRLIYGSHLGGSDDEFVPYGSGGVHGLDEAGGAVIAGASVSPDYPLTPGAYGVDVGNFAVKAVVSRVTLLPAGVEQKGSSTKGCRGSLILGVTAQPKVGASDFGIYAGGEGDYAAGYLLLGTKSLDVAVMFKQAAIWVEPASLVAVIPWKSDSTGYVELPLRIPADPSLVGFQAWAQGVFEDACSPGGIASTPALGLEIQP